jgi:hypothetical protein
MAQYTVFPMAPDEPSTFWMAGDTRSKKITAPSAARAASVRAICLISETASFTRRIGGSDFQPKAPFRKRGLNSHVWASAGVGAGVFFTGVSTRFGAGFAAGVLAGASAGFAADFAADFFFAALIGLPVKISTTLSDDRSGIFFRYFFAPQKRHRKKVITELRKDYRVPQKENRLSAVS